MNPQTELKKLIDTHKEKIEKLKSRIETSTENNSNGNSEDLRNELETMLNTCRWLILVENNLDVYNSGRDSNYIRVHFTREGVLDFLNYILTKK